MNLESLMRQAQEAQKKLQDSQKKLAQTEFTGTSGGEMVKIVVFGNFSVKQVSIDESLINKEDKEIIEDLIVAAFNDARKKIEESSSGSLKSITEAMPSPFSF